MDRKGAWKTRVILLIVTRCRFLLLGQVLLSTIASANLIVIKGRFRESQPRLSTAKVTERLRETGLLETKGWPVNRKLLVALLIVLSVGPVGTLMATGMFWSDAGSSSSNSATITLDAATGLTATVSTTLLPRTHQHYKVDLSISLGDCINPYGKPC